MHGIAVNINDIDPKDGTQRRYKTIIGANHIGPYRLLQSTSTIE